MFQRQVSFSEAVNRALTVNYCNFSGRASRSEYWWYALFSGIVNIAMFIIVALVTYLIGQTAGQVINCLVGLALFLPGLGLSVRRLHDIGKSGWWLLLAFIPLVGAIILIVWFCQDSQMADNEYGPVPNMVA